MHAITILKSEVLGFLGISHWLTMFASGDYSSLRTWDGFTSAVGPLLPVLMLIEIIRALRHKNFRVRDYRLIFFTYVLNRVLGSFISIAALSFSIAVFQPYAPFQLGIGWVGLLYGYVVWELGHFFYHYLAHKVRLFWCLHATHHSPENMNVFLSHAHHFLEAPYADLIRTTTCLLLGVSPPLMFTIMFIDGTWGTIIHIGEELMRDARLGPLQRWILTPSHHRVHHSRNPLYIDTNFCNLLNIWDRVFGTLQHEREDTPPEYGVTRPMKPGSFVDFYFGEFIALGRDVLRAPGLKNKVLYLVMPPGWSHTGAHRTAAMIRAEVLRVATGD